MSDALVAAINGEDACIYAYGVIGAQSNAPGRARKALASHRARRAALQDRSPQPVAAASAYDLPFPVTDPASARRLAVLVESRMAALYADLAAATTGEDRGQAVTAAMEAAARAVTWGGTPQAFPHG